MLNTRSTDAYSNSRLIARELWRVVQRKLKLLDAAARLDDLSTESNGNCP
jgi:hypothetical protein